MFKLTGFSYATQIDDAKKVGRYGGKPFNNAITKVDFEITNEGKCTLSYSVFNIKSFHDETRCGFRGNDYTVHVCSAEYDSRDKFEIESFNILMSKENNIKLQRIRQHYEAKNNFLSNIHPHVIFKRWFLYNKKNFGFKDSDALGDIRMVDINSLNIKQEMHKICINLEDETHELLLDKFNTAIINQLKTDFQIAKLSYNDLVAENLKLKAMIDKLNKELQSKNMKMVS